MKLLGIIDRALAGKPLEVSEALLLYEKLNLTELGHLAQVLKNQCVPNPQIVTYIIDRNVNYTNICNADCLFCAFYKKPGSKEGYVLSNEEFDQKISETLANGGDQILLQGGHNPDLGIEYYESLFRRIKKKFPIKLHALSPPEIFHICEKNNLGFQEVLVRLKEAGLDSIPGGGAEILVDQVRKRLIRHKVNSENWLNIMKIAHEMGIPTTATMMFGHIETLEDRIIHMLKLEQLQSKTNGFTAFIPWPFQKTNTPMEKGDFKIHSNEYLKTLALARIIMPHFVNLQVSFVTLGKETATLGLFFGANDYGSVMMEENVVRAAGAEYPMTEEDIRGEILLAGYIPKRRNMLYEYLEEKTSFLKSPSLTASI